MGKSTLVVGRELSKDMEFSGQFLQKSLEREGFTLNVAMWFYYPGQQWKYIIVVDNFLEIGPTVIYKKIIEINKFNHSKKYKAIQLEDIEVNGANSFIYKKMKGFIQVEKSQVRVTNSMFNGFEIVDCMIYTFK